MGNGAEAETAGAGEDALELRRRVSLFRRIEADADDTVAPRQGLIQRALGACLVKMAQEAQNQRAGNVEFALTVGKRPPQAVDHCLERNATFGVTLRVEEDLCV